MNWRDKLVTGFVNWERDVRLARDGAIAREEDEARQKMIRQIYNVKIATISDAAIAIREFDEKGEEPNLPVEIKN